MEAQYNIQLIPKDNLDSIIPLLELLNPETTQDVIVQRLADIKGADYQCVGVFDGERLIGISGIWTLNKIYAGKHIEPDNVIVHPDYRGKGVGERLMDWIHEYAISIGCLTSELNARVSNEAGRRFWERLGYKIVGYHFIKPLGRQADVASAVNTCLKETFNN
jgi:GNAT superfamily N-acetyltransferase